MLKIGWIIGGIAIDLTPTQRKVLDDILKQPEHAVFLTATGLA